MDRAHNTHYEPCARSGEGQRHGPIRCLCPESPSRIDLGFVEQRQIVEDGGHVRRQYGTRWQVRIDEVVVKRRKAVKRNARLALEPGLAV
jgi:hypothetical protein